MWFDAKRGDGQVPIVVDAEDVVHNTEATISLLCSHLGIDANGAQYTWDPAPREEWPDDPIMQGFFVDMLNSSSVKRGKQVRRVAQ